MDRVTESFLSEFSERHELATLSQSESFERFASFITIKRHYNGESFSTDDVHTGGGGDTGIDAIAILINGALVTDVETLHEHISLSEHIDATIIFIQADRGSSFDGRKISDFGFGVKDFFASEPKLRRNASINAAVEVVDELYKNGTKFRPGNPVCRLYFVTSGAWQAEPELDGRRVAVIEDLKSLQIFREVEMQCLGAEQVQQFYRQTKNAVSREFTFSNRTLLPEIAGVSEAYIGFIPLNEFITIVSDDAGELLGGIFYENVRDWQDYTAPVNEEIKETVVSNYKDRFVVMNNGITMIARILRPLRRDRFQIEDFQIVNGCQTTHVLFDCHKKSDNTVQIPLRLISTQDENVIKSVIKGTNRQTKVEDEQFFALTDFAESLEDYFQTFSDSERLYYERRSGQYTGKAVHNTRIVPHRSLVRAVGAMFLSVPHQTTRRYQSLRETVGDKIFVKGHKLEPYYVASFAAYKLDVNFRTFRIDRKLKPARYHIILAMRLLTLGEYLPPMNSHNMEKICRTMIGILSDSVHADDLCAYAASIAESEADGNFDRDNLRSQAFTERVIARCRAEQEIGKDQKPDPF